MEVLALGVGSGTKMWRLCVFRQMTPGARRSGIADFATIHRLMIGRYVVLKVVLLLLLVDERIGRTSSVVAEQLRRCAANRRLRQNPDGRWALL